MNVDKFGIITVDSKELFESLYSGKIKRFDDIYTDLSTSIEFNNSKNINKDNFSIINAYSAIDIPLDEFDKLLQSNWFMPDEYKTLDIDAWLYDKCTTEIQISRITEELKLFTEHNMHELLQYLKYLVDTMRKNKIVWGVGRGSSVASYALYLIGIHKIDSIKYNLDIKEFLK